MPLGHRPYGGYAYGGSQPASPAPPGQQIPPPVPGGTRRYRYITARGGYPYGGVSYGGGTLPPAWPGGGVVLVPDHVRAVMRVLAWWPDADYVSLVRVDACGDITPVRGAYPLEAGTTRRNRWLNPAGVAGLNGYVPADGNPTLSKLADQPTAKTTAVRATRGGTAGAVGVTLPVQFISGDQTIAAAYRFSTRPTSVTFTFAWADGAGLALTPTVLVLTANEVNRSVSIYNRQVLPVTPPAAAAQVSVKIVAAGMPAGGTVDIADGLAEDGITDGDFFDGDQLGAQWTGAAGLSVSVLAPVLTLDDGECPLDHEVRYEVSNPAFAGGRLLSDPVMLESRDTAWLTHPAHPGTPIPVLPAGVPDLERDVQQGVYPVMGSSLPVVVYGDRQAPKGTFEFGALSFAERDQLNELFDGPPLLLRCPAEYGFAPCMWVAVGATTETAGDRRVWQQTRIITAPFQQVAAPGILAAT